LPETFTYFSGLQNINKCGRFSDGFVSNKKRVLSPTDLAISLRTTGKLLVFTVGITTLVLIISSKSGQTKAE
jgi:hypothetical protein